MADVPGKFFKATKVRTGVSPSSPGVIEGETLPPLNPPGGSLNSVGLTMPSAFNVANSPLTSNGTLAVTGAGTVGQYIRGDGSLADFPQASGGGSSVSYYLNGSVNQGTIGGVAYRELSKVPILGAGTDFTINADGYIASFITDAGDPNLLEIPGGNWNFETYFSASSSGGTPTFYVELYKVSGTTATLIASSSSSPELIAFGTNLTPYYSTLAVPTTTLALTDRLAIRYYVTHSGRTITLHTENNHLCQIITTFTTGLTALNGLTAQVQNFAVGTSGTDFNIASATATHTFNLPTASATNRGALSSADWSLFRQAYNDKINSASVTGTTTKTLTLVQQDGGEIQASWSDLNTDAVTSVFGRTGAVVAVSGDYNTSQVTESGNLYFTNARAIASTLTGYVSGAGTISSADSILTAIQKLNGNIGALVTGVSSVNGQTGAVTLTTTNIAEGTNLYYTEARVNANANVAANTAARHNAVTLGTPNGLSLNVQQLSLGLASAGVTGALSGTDWSTFNSKQNALNGTGFVKISGTTISYDNSTYLTGNQTITLSGVVTGSGTTAITTAIANGAITNAMLANSSFFIGTTSISLGRASAAQTLSGVSIDGNAQYLANNAGNPANANDIWRAGVYTWFNGTNVPSGDFGLISIPTWSNTNSSARYNLQIGANITGNLLYRTTDINGAGTFRTVLDSNNFNSYAPTLGGTGATGTWSIAITGNAGTANTWTTARTITIGNTGKSVNGSANVAWSLAEIGAYAATNPSAFIALTALSGVAPIQYNNTTGAISITQASGSTNGFLSSTDWTTFNNKQNALTNPVTGTGASGQVAFWNGTTTQTGNNNLFWDNTNGRLGIGTNSPTQRLDVNGKIRLTDDLQLLSTNPTILWGSGTLRFYDNANAAVRMTLDASGNLGLGVTPSAWNSSFRAVQVGVGASFWASNISTLPYAYMSSNQLYDASNTSRYIINGFASWYIQEEGTHKWLTAPSGTAGNVITFTQAMTLFSTGNLLVGSPSPISDNGARLQVSGRGTFTNSNDQLLLKTASTNGSRIGHDALGLYFANDDTSLDVLRIYGGTSGTLRLTIASNGAATFSSGIATNGYTASVSHAALFNGNVGIFTPSPRGRLAIRTQQSDTPSLLFQNDLGGPSSAISNYETAAQTYTAFGTNFYINSSASLTRFDTSKQSSAIIFDEGTLILATGPTSATASNRFSISPIGAATFSSSVTAGGQVSINAGNGNQLYLNNSGQRYTQITFDHNSSGSSKAGLWWDNTDNFFDLYAGSGGGLRILSGGIFGAPRMVITSGGNVLIGTTTDGGARMRVEGGELRVTTSNAGVALYNNSSSGEVAAYNWGGSAYIPLNLVGLDLKFNTSTTERMRIFSDGNVLIQSGGTFTNNGARLQVSGTGHFTANLSAVFNSTSNTPYIRFDESGSAKFFIGQRSIVSGAAGTGYDFYTTSGNDLQFFTGGSSTSRLTIASTGAATFSSSVTAVNAVLGNTSNNTNAIQFLDANSTKTRLGSAFGATFIQNNNFFNGSSYVFDDNTIGSANVTLSAGTINFQTAAANTNPSTIARITTAGRLLLGDVSTDNGARLQVSGNATVSGDILVAGSFNPYTSTNRGNITLNGTSSNILAFTNNSAGRGYILHDGTDIEITNLASGQLQFFVAAGEAFRVLSGRSILTYADLVVGGKINGFDLTTLSPTGTTNIEWRLGRALLATSSVPEDRWIRVQLGNRIYDILAIDRGLA